MRHFLVMSLSAAALVGCGDDGDKPKDAAVPKDSPVVVDTPVADAAPDGTTDAAPDAPSIRGPLSFDLAGGANSLLWDSATSTLYFTDNNSDKLRKYTDAGGLADVAALPAGSAGISLGDIVKQADGSILVASFGFGTQGTLFRVATAGTSEALTGLAANRRRIGLGKDAAGGLYEAYFTGGMGMPQLGGVSSVTIAGSAATETEVATASAAGPLHKLVGLVVTTGFVYVSDQTDKKIYKIATTADHTVTELATVPAADLLSLMPNGDLLDGGDNVYRVTPTGTVTTLVADVDQVRGTAFDSVMRRLFIIEHSTMAGVPDRLLIRPLDN